MSNEEEMKRIWGAFYGQVIGDAIGVTCEFLNVEATAIEMAEVRAKAGRNGEDSVFPMVGCEDRKIKPGQFTDDTEMALSLARSLIAKKGFDKVDVACAYSYWLCGTEPSDSGFTTQRALHTDLFSQTGLKKNVQGHNTQSLSNGALMRISSLAIAFRNFSTKELREVAKADSSLTHANPIVWDAVATYCVALAALLKGKSISEAFDEAFESTKTPMIREYLKDAKTHDIPVKLYQEDFSQPFKTINGDAEHQDAIARGGDADTNGCIVGALIGARFGVDNIPQEWIDTVRAAEPCRLSNFNVRKDMDLTFLSIKDIDELVPQLVAICKG
uniref:ADP-ribosylhydrolase ARH3 n=1 Tax=Panagrolaimus davidi TaxID=227884 RepID=A0A914QCT6_9BILA